ncbi:MAG: response regulator [Pleurocapsa sp. MO_192.B19]|nr:response regulator [Pleurocapsa sp. MO_192.B19]
MMIEDEELRELYKTSSSEHLQKLESELMILEKNPQDTSAVEEFLREAHTLKGDSRMLGLNDIEMLVHQLEDCVEDIKAGKGDLTPELCDRLYQGIDAVNQLSHQAITGEAVEVNTFEVLALLMGASDVAEPSGNSEADLFADESSSEASLFDDDDADDLFADESSSEASLFDDDDDVTESIIAVEPEQVPDTFAVNNSQPTKAANRDYKIDTIRVEPQKLDTLMTQASELAVTKLRISQQMTEINQMLALWEGWNKSNSGIDNLFEGIEERLTPEQFVPLRHFFSHAQQYLNSLGHLASNLKTRASEDVASLSIIADRLETGIQGLRQLPLSTVFNIYPRMVRDLARQQGKEIDLVIEGGDTKADKLILEEIKDPLLHLIRNAIDHGIETSAERISQGKPATATIVLRGYQTGSSIGIEISDDGRGLNLESISNTAIKRKVLTEAELSAMSESEIQSLIFASGFSTRTEITELSGRGVGLDVVRANVERLKGSIQVTSTPGNGCKFQVRLNTSLATTKILIVEINQTLYALPLEFIQTMLTITPQDIYAIKGNQTITFDQQPISVAWLADLLKLPTSENYTTGKHNLACIILQIGNDKSDGMPPQRFGVIVDDLVDQQDVVLKPQSKLLKRIPNIVGATILGSGAVCMILNPPDLLHSLRNGSWQDISRPVESAAIKNKLLLVEDSIIIRTQMQRLLKGAGYDVTVATNGLEGLHKVQEQDFDIVLSDVEMPNMNGLEMTTAIRQQSKYKQLPIVLITTLASPEDKRRGKDAGANAYLTKGDFDQQLLFNTLNQLINLNN